MEVWDSTPRLAFLSPEPKSGKTRAIEVSASLVPLPVEAVNVSPAYLFRKVGGDDGRPTILFDEVDTVFGPKAKENEEVRGLLNAGHRKGAVAGRCVVHGKQVMTEEIPAYCAVALAGLGWLPDTILTRSIIIRMRRRKPGEKVEPWRHRIHAKEGEALGDHLAGWARHVQPLMMGVYPEMPPGIEDRDADVWEALLAVADAAGGDWPKAARAAAVALVKEATEVEPSLGIRLLHDLRTVFGARAHMRTAAILEGLIALPESPWGDLKGKPINDRILARRLQQYGIKSKDIKAEGRALKGYTREDLHDAWLRYLPLVTPERRDQRDQRDDPSEFAAAATEPVADSPFSKRDHSAAKRDQGANGRDDERDPDFEGDQNSSRILSSVAEVADVALVRGNGGDGDGKSNGSQIGGTETDPRHLPLAEAMAYRQINVDEVWITSKAGGGYHRDRNRTRR
jgi:hypothetical protein